MIPAVYENAQGRKVIKKDISPAAILGKPNHIGIAVYIIVVALLTILILGLIRIKKGKKHKKSRKRGRHKTYRPRRKPG